MNQDELGVAGDLIWKEGPNEVCHHLWTHTSTVASFGGGQFPRALCTSTDAGVPIHCVTDKLDTAVGCLCLQVYAGPLKGGARAVVLFNRHSPDYRYAASYAPILVMACCERDGALPVKSCCCAIPAQLSADTST